MDTPEPRITRSVDASAWSPPLPEASGFDHLVVETPGLRTHVAAIGEGEPVVLLHGFPAALVAVARRSLRSSPQAATASSAPTCAGPAGPWPTIRASNARPGSATCSPSSTPSTSSAPTSSPTTWASSPRCS